MRVISLLEVKKNNQIQLSVSIEKEKIKNKTPLSLTNKNNQINRSNPTILCGSQLVNCSMNTTISCGIWLVNCSMLSNGSYKNLCAKKKKCLSSLPWEEKRTIKFNWVWALKRKKKNTIYQWRTRTIKSIDQIYLHFMN